MALVYEGIGTADIAADTSDTTVSPGVPAGTSVGDLLIAVLATAQRDPAASGWDRISADDVRCNFLYRVADGTEGSTVDFTFTPTTYTKAHGFILRFSGADASSLSLPTEGNDTSGDEFIDLPSVTVATAGSALIMTCTAVSNSTRTGEGCSRGSADEVYDTPDAYALNPITYVEEDVAAGSISGETIELDSSHSNFFSNVLVIPPASSSSIAPVFFNNILAG